MDTVTYQGAIRNTTSHNTSVKRWDLTDSAEKLANVDDQDVIWVSSTEELLAELERRYPHDSGLSRCVVYGIGVQVYDYPVVDVSDANNNLSRSDTDVLDKILSAARIAGTICIFGWHLPKGVYDECVLVGSGSPLTIEYNPKRAQKLKDRSLRRDLSLPIQGRQFHGIAIDLTKALRPYVYENCPDCNRSRPELVAYIVRMLWLHEYLFGRGSFRRVKHWQEFVGRWRTLQKPTETLLAKEEAKWRDDGCANTADRVAAFVKFMAKEVKRKKMPPPYKAGETGKVKKPIGPPK